jgi:thiosulfate reductase cytochrome b subunit
VRATHWLTTLAFFALLVSGAEIVLSHPRFYWGEQGTVNTPALFQLPVPASRAMVKTAYNYVLPDQNGWSRYLHFQSAWIVLFVGALYLVYGVWSSHFRRSLIPQRGQLAWKSVRTVVRGHLRLTSDQVSDDASYNVLQRAAYLSVIFVLFPLVIWSGLAMAPGFTAIFPFSVESLGGKQSARTIHFFVSIALVAFLGVHVAMVALSGFRSRMRGMITGATEGSR